MVFTLPVIITVVVVALAGLSVTFRTWLFDLAGGAADYMVGSWPVIRRALFWAVVAGGTGWLLLIVLMIFVGAYANSVVSALIISFLFPVWFMAFIMPPFANRLWVIGPMMRGMRTIGSPILVVATIILLVSVWSPDIKGSFDRWSHDKKQSVAYALDKSSLQSEAEFGVIGKTKAVTAIYDNDLNPIRDREGKKYLKLRQGVRVKAVDTEGRNGMTQVILENPNGDFAKGNAVFIPSDQIDWDA
jgi:hypothetical protein